ncbi:hypothetical protein L596_030293 [Steinernema carpocapsae]|uniref:Uncharacterized protein n=1 Tax=Steinernema carpocapsae TaxID=34508 RepID=A0A4U5LP13_STECR|nr:hypothetical protein L596_030293 [Steinernema carpocapsae]
MLQCQYETRRLPVLDKEVSEEAFKDLADPKASFQHSVTEKPENLTSTTITNIFSAGHVVSSFEELAEALQSIPPPFVTTLALDAVNSDEELQPSPDALTSVEFTLNDSLGPAVLDHDVGLPSSFAQAQEPSKCLRASLRPKKVVTSKKTKSKGSKKTTVKPKRALEREASGHLGETLDAGQSKERSIAKGSSIAKDSTAKFVEFKFEEECGSKPLVDPKKSETGFSEVITAFLQHLDDPMKTCFAVTSPTNTSMTRSKAFKSHSDWLYPRPVRREVDSAEPTVSTTQVLDNPLDSMDDCNVEEDPNSKKEITAVTKRLAKIYIARSPMLSVTLVQQLQNAEVAQQLSTKPTTSSEATEPALLSPSASTEANETQNAVNQPHKKTQETNKRPPKKSKPIKRLGTMFPSFGFAGGAQGLARVKAAEATCRTQDSSAKVRSKRAEKSSRHAGSIASTKPTLKRRYEAGANARIAKAKITKKEALKRDEIMSQTDLKEQGNQKILSMNVEEPDEKHKAQRAQKRCRLSAPNKFVKTPKRRYGDHIKNFFMAMAAKKEVLTMETSHTDRIKRETEHKAEKLNSQSSQGPASDSKTNHLLGVPTPNSTDGS